MKSLEIFICRFHHNTMIKKIGRVLFYDYNKNHFGRIQDDISGVSLNFKLGKRENDLSLKDDQLILYNLQLAKNGTSYYATDISIIDSSIVDLKKEEILDCIFEEFYKAKDEKFLKLIDLLCVKDDKEVKKLILDVNSKIDLIEDKNAYLDSYERLNFRWFNFSNPTDIIFVHLKIN